MNEIQVQEAKPATINYERAIWLLVSAAATGAGAFFGSFMFPVGTFLGAFGGLLAGLVWVNRMRRRVYRGKTAILFFYGIKWGVLAGLLATVILHGGLMLICIFKESLQVIFPSVSLAFRDYLLLAGIAIPIGFLCALVAGAVVGALSTLVLCACVEKQESA